MKLNRYEVLHLKKEVNRCINFWSADEDIDLVDVNNFYAEAPKDVSKPDITKGMETSFKKRLCL